VKVGALIEPRSPGAADFAIAAQRIGVSSLWVPEVWGYDALTGLAYLAAKTTSIGLGTFVVQLGSRSPALLATSALSLQELSGGRFMLGVGTSGPGVMEGWHGVRFKRPVQTTRETIEIVRTVSRGDRLEHSGEIYPLPLPNSAGSVLRPLVRPDHVPVYVAAMGPQNLHLTGEVADGWLGNAFIPEAAEAFLAPLREGAQLAGRTLADLDLQIPVAVEFTEDVDEAVARHAAGYAFTIGAMDSATTNFYNNAFARQGFGEQVAEVARLWRDGRREEAARLVPLEIGEKTNLLGTPAMIADRIRLHRAAGVSTLQLKLDGPLSARLDTLARITELVSAVNKEY
jgi:F420-dependent oxidoreductase-like protein